jgi:hypothetical protein
MAIELSDEQVRQQYINAMGRELGQVFHYLWKECAWLHLKWHEFVTLFGTNAKRVDLLNAAAPAFFKIVQDLLWEDTLLHICRLTDPAVSPGKRENLTVCRLPMLVLPALRPKVEHAVAATRCQCKFARDWRNRHIVHRDYPLALDKHANPLEPATIKSVSEALASIAGVLNILEGQYRHHEPIPYHMPIEPLGNAEALLYLLRDGLDARAALQRRLESGKFLPEDMIPPPAI